MNCLIVKADELQCITRLGDYISNVSVEPFEITVQNKSMVFNPPHKVYLSPLLFQDDQCQRCGRCCNQNATIYLDYEYELAKTRERQEFERWGLDYDDKQRLFEDMDESSFQLNGRKLSYHGIFMSNREKKEYTIEMPGRSNFIACKWLSYNEDGLSACKIYPCQTYGCKEPLIQIVRNSVTNIVYIRKSFPARNWIVGCKNIFSPFTYKAFMEKTLPFFQRFNTTVKQDLNVETCLDAILEYFEKNIENFKRGIIPQEKVLVYEQRGDIKTSKKEETNA